MIIILNYHTVTLTYLLFFFSKRSHLSWTWQHDDLSIVLCVFLANCGLQLRDRNPIVFTFARERTTTHVYASLYI